MRYETERKIIDGMNKLFNAESEDIIQKNKALQEEVNPLKEEIAQLKKQLKWLRWYKDQYDHLMILIWALCEDGIIKDTSWDQWVMTEDWPQWERWIQYEYKEEKYDIANWSL